MSFKIETVDTLAATGSRLSIAAGGATAVFGFIQENAIGIGGLLIALISFLVNVHYKRKADRRRAEEIRIRNEEAARRELRHTARAEMQIAVARQAMELREEARKQKAEEWAARKEYMRVTGRAPADPPPTDWRGLEELQFPTDEAQDRADAKRLEDEDDESN